LKSDICDYVNSPTTRAKYGFRRKWGVGWACGWSCNLACFLFYLFFGSFSASTAYPEKRGFSLSASKNVFCGGCVPLGSIYPEGQIFLFLPPKNIFQWVE